ncbi:MAG: SH3 domain-containing protein, partial [Saprospiraceae bacterium]|nr:SH3 domain-containing protein [Saprospiraceae bacterium]
DDKAQALYQAILNDNSEIEPAAGNNLLIRSIKNISSVFMPLTWLILAVFFLIPVGFYIFRNPFQSFSFSKYNLYPIVFSLLFIVFSMLGLYRNQQIFHNKTIVITSENTILKVGPDLKSPDLDTLAPGSIVYFEDNLAGWWQVRNAYGDTGWIEAGKGKKI